MGDLKQGSGIPLKYYKDFFVAPQMYDSIYYRSFRF